MRIERIDWIDSGFHVHEGWTPVIDALSDFKFDDMLVHSAGIFAYEDDDMVGLTSSLNEKSESVFGLQLIAKSNIRLREVLYDSEAQLLPELQPADGILRDGSLQDEGSSVTDSGEVHGVSWHVSPTGRHQCIGFNCGDKAHVLKGRD